VRALVIGGGVSGLGAAKLLRSQGHEVRVSDAGSIAGTRREEFLRLRAEICDGGHKMEHLDGVGLVVFSPGVRADHLLLLEGAKRGVKLVSEIDYALSSFSGELIGVTGTNGKSTTCVMIGHMLRSLGFPAVVGGNLGDPPTAMAAENRLSSPLVLELSSYQLELSRDIHPRVALFTSFSHDHIQRHGTIENYFRAKWRLFEGIPAGGAAIMPAYIRDLAEKFNCRSLGASLISIQQPSFTASGANSAPPPGESGEWYFPNQHTARRHALRESVDFTLLKYREPHNLLNALLAALACEKVTGRKPQEFIDTLATFRGLPHRCELVGHMRGHAIINDSKSTNVESTLVALDAQDTPVILLLGGQGKDEPYAPILTRKARIRRIVTFGASGKVIAGELRDSISTSSFPTLAEALAALRKELMSEPGPVLFSPACASFDEFRNFEHRGDFFTSALRSDFDESKSGLSRQ